MTRTAKKKPETKTILLEAARKVLRESGYAAFSTRGVAARARVPLSQIHYHFGSKQGLLLELFAYLNGQLLERQQAMFDDRSLSLSQRWDRACDYLDEDIASGYVRVMQELIAASWSDPAVARAVSGSVAEWSKLIVAVAREAETSLGSLGGFTPEEVGAFAASAFVGVESLELLGFEKRGVPLRAGLRRFGDLIRKLESTSKRR